MSDWKRKQEDDSDEEYLNGLENQDDNDNYIDGDEDWEQYYEWEEIAEDQWEEANWDDDNNDDDNDEDDIDDDWNIDKEKEEE